MILLLIIFINHCAATVIATVAISLRIMSFKASKLTCPAEIILSIASPIRIGAYRVVTTVTTENTKDKITKNIYFLI